MIGTAAANIFEPFEQKRALNYNGTEEYGGFIFLSAGETLIARLDSIVWDRESEIHHQIL